MLIAAMGHLPANAPRFSNTTGAVILAGEIADRLGRKDGDMMADFQSANDRPYLATVICHVDEFVANFRGLCDHLSLTDTDRIAMFDVLRNWIRKDFRAVSSTVEGEKGDTDAVN
jgi:hypothetical protein